MEEVLIPLFFFGSLFAFPLLRRQMIHRHRLELLRGPQAAAPGLSGAPTANAAATTSPSAADLALRLPEPHRLYTLALLCRLQDALGGPPLPAHSAYVVRQALAEYLPATLGAYLGLGLADHARLDARGTDAETLLREQLELINAGVAEALGHSYAPADRLLTQGHFLGERFEAAAVRARA